MSHLSPVDLVDALGPVLTSRAASHLAECDACRREVDDLRAALETIKDADVPEPVPFFWPRFTARVVDLASSVSRRAVRWPAMAPGIAWTRALAAAALLLSVASAAVLWRDGLTVTVPPSASPTDAMTQTVHAVRGPDASDDVSPWDLLADASTGIDWEVVSEAGLAPAPGSADRAVLQLSEGERSELVRLLQVELAGSL
jgi:hypothetical protein